MKILKLNHDIALEVAAGTKHSTWRLFDDKDLSIGDEVELVDKVDSADRGSWQIIGVAVITGIVETQLGTIADTETTNHEAFDSRSALLKTYQGYYGSEVTFETPVKVLTFDFTPIQTATNFIQAVTPMPSSAQWRELKLFGDGGSRGNPGPSASGYVLLDMHDHKLVDEGVYLGITTNNQAEYLSLKYGMEEALKRGARILHVHMDSLLVINQMKGIFKVKNRDLWAVHQTIKDMLPRFEKVTFTHVPREYNRLADAAVNRTLDAESGPRHASA